ncbi:hypothetical protein DC31_04810 [Microbacterium sp. CH12i]|uniref:hypothetical protein n=1 Tax=Microbacterium sp. CH12i TaxID=1479651 RepID=UPI0004614400|nr:hypothetical protein [Microbacterium sp. CH12i]KDA04839.1 hypothetical protein DC31_04810 [Microbacterium sp. CH12i]
MTSRQLRLLRGATASSVATIIAAVSHTIGGGTPPHPLLVIALSVFLAPISTLLVGRTPGLAKLSTAVLVSQVVFHVLFVALGATLTPGVAVSGHQHVLTLPTVAATLPAASGDAAMAGAHFFAGILTVAMLWRGEQLLRAIARWVRAVLRVRMPQLPADWPIPASLGETTHIFVSTIRVGDISLRGPPLLSHG